MVLAPESGAFLPRRWISCSRKVVYSGYRGLKIALSEENRFVCEDERQKN